MNIIKSPIISCSRRTDIPAFLMDWVIKKIKIGYVNVVNPFYHKQISCISLKPEHVKCWVWWSKNFEDWIKKYTENKNLFKSYKGHSFQFTINSPSELEPNVKISLERRFQQLKWLINEFGLLAMNYRFDPIILYKKYNSNTIRSNLDKFEYIIENIAALGLKEMIFSLTCISYFGNFFAHNLFNFICINTMRLTNTLDTMQVWLTTSIHFNIIFRTNFDHISKNFSFFFKS